MQQSINTMKTTVRKEERIDIRVSPEEKELFLKAQRLSGDRTFSGFVTRIIKAKSTEIVEENIRILASQRDREIFFKSIFSEQEPNEALKEAVKRFKSHQE